MFHGQMESKRCAKQGAEELLLGAVLRMLYFIVLLQLQALTIATSVDALECFFIILVSMLQEQQLKAEEARAKLVNFCGGQRDATRRNATPSLIDVGFC